MNKWEILETKHEYLLNNCQKSKYFKEVGFTTLYFWSFLDDLFILKHEYGIVVAEEITTHKNIEAGYYVLAIFATEEKFDMLISAASTLEINGEQMKGFYFLFEETAKAIYEILNTKKKIIVSGDFPKDYFYLSENFITFSGKKLQKKRNARNKFISMYGDKTVVKKINKETIPQISSFLKKKKEYSEKNQFGFLLNDFDSNVEFLKNIHLFKGEGSAYFINDECVGFSYGEFNGSYADIFIEKFNTFYKGLGAFISSDFVNRHYKDIKIVSREDDNGEKGLTLSKESYKPEYLKGRYGVIINYED